MLVMVVEQEILVSNSMHSIFHLPNFEYLNPGNSTIDYKERGEQVTSAYFRFYSSLTTQTPN